VVALLSWSTTAGMREGRDREFGRTIRLCFGPSKEELPLVQRSCSSSLLGLLKSARARAAPGTRDQWRAVASPVAAPLARASRRIRAHGRSRRGKVAILSLSLFGCFFGEGHCRREERGSLREQRAPGAVGLGEASRTTATRWLVACRGLKVCYAKRIKRMERLCSDAGRVFGAGGGGRVEPGAVAAPLAKTDPAPRGVRPARPILKTVRVFRRLGRADEPVPRITRETGRGPGAIGVLWRRRRALDDERFRRASENRRSRPTKLRPTTSHSQHTAHAVPDPRS
jgi:hypothetical protein